MSRLASIAIVVGGAICAASLTLLALTHVARETILAWGPFAGVVLMVCGGMLLAVADRVPLAAYRHVDRLVILASGGGLAIVSVAVARVVEATISGPIAAIGLMLAGLVVAALALGAENGSVRLGGVLVAAASIAVPFAVAGTHPDCGELTARVLAQTAGIVAFALAWIWLGVVALREAHDADLANGPRRI